MQNKRKQVLRLITLFQRRIQFHIIEVKLSMFFGDICCYMIYLYFFVPCITLEERNTDITYFETV